MQNAWSSGPPAHLAVETADYSHSVYKQPSYDIVQTAERCITGNPLMMGSSAANQQIHIPRGFAMLADNTLVPLSGIQDKIMMPHQPQDANTVNMAGLQMKVTSHCVMDQQLSLHISVAHLC